MTPRRRRTTLAAVAVVVIAVCVCFAVVQMGAPGWWQEWWPST